MRREPLAYLWDVRRAIDAIRSFVESLDEESYLASTLVKSAVERQLEIIGEALNQLSNIDATITQQLPESELAIGLRNILIHGYAIVDDSLVWRTVNEDLPALRDRVETLLSQRQ